MRGRVVQRAQRGVPGGVVLPVGAGGLAVPAPGIAGAGLLPGGGPSWPNAPAGWTLITDTTWEAASLGTWGSGTRDGWSIKFVDATRSAAIETISDGTIGETRALTHVYPANHDGGGGAEPYINFGGAYRSLYLGMYVRVSANWWGHPSGIAKLAYIRTDDGSFSAMWVEYRASGDSQPLEPLFVNQLAGGSGIGETTRTSGYPTRGTWHRVEALVELDVPRARYWVDGTLWIDYSFSVSTSSRISEVTLSGIMGGVGASGNPSEQRMQYDRVRILVN